MERSGIDGLTHLNKMFGSETMRTVVFLTNHWGGREREDYRQQEATVWEDFVVKKVQGSRQCANLRRLDNTGFDPKMRAMEIIEDILQGPLNCDPKIVNDIRSRERESKSEPARPLQKFSTNKRLIVFVDPCRLYRIL